MPAPDLTSDMPTIVREGWNVGQSIELEGIGYGRIHWGNKSDVQDQPHPYYHFLAGTIRAFGFGRVLEIGTHWGGATRAMWTGADGAARKVVTVDISTESDNRLKTYPEIVKVVGDANVEETMLQVVRHFDGRPIDLLYVDALHYAYPTFLNYAIYTAALRPKMVIFDDITLNDDMKRLWSWVQQSNRAEDTINAVDVEPEIRAKPGFGVVRLSGNL